MEPACYRLSFSFKSIWWNHIAMEEMVSHRDRKLESLF